MNNKLQVTNNHNIPFDIIIIKKGDTYQIENTTLTHQEDDPRIEFYDARNNEILCSFAVSRLDSYNMEFGQGNFIELVLVPDKENMQLTKENMADVMRFIHETHKIPVFEIDMGVIFPDDEE